jgi:hypothetical protein
MHTINGLAVNLIIFGLNNLYGYIFVNAFVISIAETAACIWNIFTNHEASPEEVYCA